MLSVYSLLSACSPPCLLHALCSLLALTWPLHEHVPCGKDAGIKQQEGWKAFTEEVGVWEKLSKKDQASKNNLIFVRLPTLSRHQRALCPRSSLRPHFSEFHMYELYV